ncbi:uncharacterized protein TNIN_14561 [Trichonephila inaurata madagascariensis]|uniref:Gustatory receptor n=1 Tax=Trichonephila inaurata madagascariensis TaxID=2747483 RepID=A0A8X7CUI7_9ARAC|nr:uncharacterized protein TNIN_14561 [Trichonephila inaurata madagascariensis]
MSAVTILKWFGFIQNHNPSFKSTFIAAILQISMVVIYLDIFVMYFIATAHDNLLLKIVVEKLYSISTTMIVMVMLIRRRRALTSLLNKTYFICHPFSQKMINTITSCVLILLFSYGATFLLIYKYGGDDYALVFFFYKMPLESEMLKHLIVYSKAFVYFFFYPTFSNLVVLVFCTACHRCSHSLSNLSKELEKCSSKTFTVDVQVKYLKCRRRIIKLLEKTQDVFSPIIFLICSASFSCCFAMLGQLIFYSYKNGGLSFLSDTLFNSLSALISLISMFWIPGEVPIEMNKFDQAIRKKYELRAVSGVISENSSVERAFFEGQVFVLSACNLIFFTKESVLTVLGTILTYGLLIISLDLRSFP